MNGRRIAKLVHEGTYVAQVDVETIFTEEGWSPYVTSTRPIVRRLRAAHAEIEAEIARRKRQAA